MPSFSSRFFWACCIVFMGWTNDAQAEDAAPEASPSVEQAEPPESSSPTETQPAQAAPSPPPPYPAAYPHPHPEAQYAQHAPPLRHPKRVRVPYEDGLPIPPGGVVVSRDWRTLWLAGISTFAASYAWSLISMGLVLGEGTRDERKAAPYLIVPIAGPFLYVIQADLRGDLFDPGPLVIALSGIAQTVGVLLFTLGQLFPKRKQLIYYTEGPAGRKLALTPSFGPTGAGLQLSF